METGVLTPVLWRLGSGEAGARAAVATRPRTSPDWHGANRLRPPGPHPTAAAAPDSGPLRAARVERVPQCAALVVCRANQAAAVPAVLGRRLG